MTSKGKKQPFPNVFYVHRKRGKSSPKSYELFSKAAPHFPNPSQHQKDIGRIGRECGRQIKGNPKYAGKANVNARRDFMGSCVSSKWGTPKKAKAAKE